MSNLLPDLTFLIGLEVISLTESRFGIHFGLNSESSIQGSVYVSLWQGETKIASWDPSYRAEISSFDILIGKQITSYSIELNQIDSLGGWREGRTLLLSISNGLILSIYDLGYDEILISGKSASITLGTHSRA